jgi:hypothetical protein
MSNWSITQEMMDRATAIFTQTTGNPLADAKRIEPVVPWRDRASHPLNEMQAEINDLRAMLEGPTK